MNYDRTGLLKGATCPAKITKCWKFSLLWAVTWEMRLAIQAARRHITKKDNLHRRRSYDVKHDLYSFGYKQ